MLCRERGLAEEANPQHVNGKENTSTQHGTSAKGLVALGDGAGDFKNQTTVAKQPGADNNSEQDTSRSSTAGSCSSMTPRNGSDAECRVVAERPSAIFPEHQLTPNGHVTSLPDRSSVDVDLDSLHDMPALVLPDGSDVTIVNDVMLPANTSDVATSVEMRKQSLDTSHPAEGGRLSVATGSLSPVGEIVANDAHSSATAAVVNTALKSSRTNADTNILPLTVFTSSFASPSSTTTAAVSPKAILAPNLRRTSLSDIPLPSTPASNLVSDLSTQSEKVYAEDRSDAPSDANPGIPIPAERSKSEIETCVGVDSLSKCQFDSETRALVNNGAIPLGEKSFAASAEDSEAYTINLDDFECVIDLPGFESGTEEVNGSIPDDGFDSTADDRSPFVNVDRRPHSFDRDLKSSIDLEMQSDCTADASTVASSKADAAEPPAGDDRKQGPGLTTICASSGDTASVQSITADMSSVLSSDPRDSSPASIDEGVDSPAQSVITSVVPVVKKSLDESSAFLLGSAAAVSSSDLTTTEVNDLPSASVDAAPSTAAVPPSLAMSSAPFILEDSKQHNGASPPRIAAAITSVTYALACAPARSAAAALCAPASQSASSAAYRPAKPAHAPHVSSPCTTSPRVSSEQSHATRVSAAGLPRGRDESFTRTRSPVFRSTEPEKKWRVGSFAPPLHSLLASTLKCTRTSPMTLKQLASDFSFGAFAGFARQESEDASVHEDGDARFATKATSCTHSSVSTPDDAGDDLDVDLRPIGHDERGTPTSSHQCDDVDSATNDAPQPRDTGSSMLQTKPGVGQRSEGQLCAADRNAIYKLDGDAEQASRKTIHCFPTELTVASDSSIPSPKTESVAGYENATTDQAFDPLLCERLEIGKFITKKLPHVSVTNPDLDRGHNSSCAVVPCDNGPAASVEPDDDLSLCAIPRLGEKVEWGASGPEPYPSSESDRSSTAVGSGNSSDRSISDRCGARSCRSRDSGGQVAGRPDRPLASTAVHSVERRPSRSVDGTCAHLHDRGVAVDGNESKSWTISADAGARCRKIPVALNGKHEVVADLEDGIEKSPERTGSLTDDIRADPVSCQIPEANNATGEFTATSGYPASATLNDTPLLCEAVDRDYVSTKANPLLTAPTKPASGLLFPLCQKFALSEVEGERLQACHDLYITCSEAPCHVTERDVQSVINALDLAGSKREEFLVSGAFCSLSSLRGCVLRLRFSCKSAIFPVNTSSEAPTFFSNGWSGILVIIYLEWQCQLFVGSISLKLKCCYAMFQWCGFWTSLSKTKHNDVSKRNDALFCKEVVVRANLNCSDDRQVWIYSIDQTVPVSSDENIKQWYASFNRPRWTHCGESITN